MADAATLWRKHAGLWQHVGQPLRPTPYDTRVMERYVARCHAANNNRALNALMLGVTVEIATMRWPRGTQLLALDRSWSMVAGIWPGDDETRCAIVGDWLRPPLRAQTWDVIAADGALNMLPEASAYAPLLDLLRGLQRRGGHMVMRAFVRPDIEETAGAVFAALCDGRIGNFNIFKFRLAMALQGSFETGIARDAVWQAWDAERGTATRTCARLAWPSATVQTIEAFRGVTDRFSFPTLAELRTALDPGFIERACEVPDYEMGDRCPTLWLQARAAVPR